MANKITYTRGTTYTFGFSYTAPQYLGVTLLFTVKNVPNDTDSSDTTNVIMAQKVISMTGATFPQTTTITINPTDVADTVLPSTSYYWSIKVFDSNNNQFIPAEGTFNLVAYSTNETST